QLTSNSEKNRKQGDKSTRKLPGIGFNLTENGDYDIAGYQLVNVKSPQESNDAVNLQYLTKSQKQYLDNAFKKDDSESILKIVKPELIRLKRMIRKMENNIKKTNLTSTKGYIDMGTRRLFKVADAVDKDDVANKRQLDNYGIPMTVEVIKFYSDASLKDLQFGNNSGYFKTLHY
ncbi:hypothetical protein BDFB_012984, partial [Asbolus verrucosus]